MKRLVMAVAALMISATISLQAQGMSQEPFNANLDKLSSYLKLTPYQVTEVASINGYFKQMQLKSLNGTPERQEEKMYDAIYGNLKLMKDVLNTEQYRKYVTVLNVTNNNNRLSGMTSLSGNYLADNR